MTEHDKGSRGSREGPTSETARDTAAEVGKQARVVAGNVKATAQAKSEALMDRAEEKAREKKSQAAEMIGALATALHAAGDTLREQRQDRLGRMGITTANQVDRMASYIERNDVRGLIDDLEHFGRRNPVAFLGIAFAGGLLAGRFLRSSQSPDDTRRERHDDWDHRYEARADRLRSRDWERERQREMYREPGTTGTRPSSSRMGATGSAPSGVGTGNTFPTDPMIDDTSPSLAGMPPESHESLGAGRTPPGPGLTTPRTGGASGGSASHPSGGATGRHEGGSTGGTNE